MLAFVEGALTDDGLLHVVGVLVKISFSEERLIGHRLVLIADSVVAVAVAVTSGALFRF
jgi:hypothetical protein